jgi:hypothetical protein
LHLTRRCHVRIVGILGLVGDTVGAIAAIALVDLGPTWYPIALAATAYHSVWLGGVLHGRLHAER